MEKKNWTLIIQQKLSLFTAILYVPLKLYCLALLLSYPNSRLFVRILDLSVFKRTQNNEKILVPRSSSGHFFFINKIYSPQSHVSLSWSLLSPVQHFFYFLLLDPFFTVSSDFSSFLCANSETITDSLNYLRAMPPLPTVLSNI